jgi:dolichol kinase
MGPNRLSGEHHLLLGLMAAGVGMAIPATQKIAVKVEALGSELSWGGHIGVFVMVFLAVFVFLVLVLAALRAVVEIVERCWSCPRDRR